MLVDDEDFEKMNRSWNLASNGYAKRTKRVDGVCTTMFAHRELLGLVRGDKQQVDHKDHNRLNNQKENLRICTPAQNQANARAHKDGCGLKGVCYAKDTGKWQTSIKYAGKLHYLGQFDTPGEAHEVYCLALDMVHGDFSFHG